MWEGLEAIDWAGLEHNYGSAEDVPGLLRRCAAPDQSVAQDAAFELLNLLYHQGGWICSAATAALPFLLRLAAAPSVPSRLVVLELVTRLASEADEIAGRFLHPGWSPTWERLLPEVLVLLADPEPEIRRAAAGVVGVCASPGALTLPALLRCWRAESDPVTRLDLVLALGPAARREPTGDRSDEVDTLLHASLASPEPQLRLAAVHALTARDSTPATTATTRLRLVLEAVRDPSVELWRHTSSVESGVRGVQHWSAGLFPGASPAYTLGLMADHPDEEQRIGALAQAGGFLSQWRSPTNGLLPAIAARLDDSVTEVRYRAAELLACCGPAAAVHADAVAELLGDTANRTSRERESVADAALWALARMNDPRCLPGLAERVAGTPSGFASADAFTGGAGDAIHYPALPALSEALARLPDRADVLLPAICDRLGPTEDVRLVGQLCNVLAAWGPAAKAAVPQLLGLLEDSQRWTAAATALAGIGPAGNGGREALLARSLAGGADAELAAWAYWQVGGEPGPALKVLGPAATEGRYPHPALRKLADLGSHAAAFAGRIRAMDEAADPWTRAEAAHALWAVTGDTESAVPILVEIVQELTDGTYLPVMLPAVRYLTRMGHAAQPAVRLLRDLPASDRRIHYFGGWRAFTEDESLRTAVDELLATAD
ncbi:HEAT repeat domain-containing protein [Streptomyces sp. b94]|uniref:HEAT repeat domain-containing protein n=1 Tax=Streptomyces sp. b94 TaxID=1827634 RepID=UPI001B377642|nr:HEAT repeat domain-containing protein [Streptomyces sp. b94]MBQ1095376.1 HEAT repeat domain-containing protein [Streptomyces sp. b94]